MRILFNPENGSIIKDVMFKDEVLFSSKEDEVFEPGMVVRVTDEVFDFLLGNPDVKAGLFQFLEEMEPEQAQEYMASSKDRLKCEKCDFTTRVQSSLDKHMREHKREMLVDELGIPLVGRAKREAVNEDPADAAKRREKAWEEENTQSGLDVGRGMENDRPAKQVVMS